MRRIRTQSKDPFRRHKTQLVRDSSGRLPGYGALRKHRLTLNVFLRLRIPGRMHLPMGLEGRLCSESLPTRRAGKFRGSGWDQIWHNHYFGAIKRLQGGPQLRSVAGSGLARRLLCRLLTMGTRNSCQSRSPHQCEEFHTLRTRHLVDCLCHGRWTPRGAEIVKGGRRGGTTQKTRSHRAHQSVTTVTPIRDETKTRSTFMAHSGHYLLSCLRTIL